MKFHELMNRMLHLNDKMELQYGEVMEEDDLALLEVDESLEWWTNYLIERSKEEKANAQAAKDLASHYAERAKMFERKEEYRKQGIFALVQMAGKPVKTVAGNARIQDGVMGVMINCPPEMLPEEYKKVSYSADKAAIKKDLEAGKELNYAVLERGKPFLVIR